MRVGGVVRGGMTGRRADFRGKPDRINAELRAGRWADVGVAAEAAGVLGRDEARMDEIYDAPTELG